MIKMADSAGEAAPKPWAGIPAPGPIVMDPEPNDPRPQFPPAGNPNGFAVPPAWHDPDNPVDNHRLPALKSDAYYYARMNHGTASSIRPSSPAFSLGALGALLEFTVTTPCTCAGARSCTTRSPAFRFRGPAGRRIGWQMVASWITITLASSSSHVNPVFWRLYVDDRINDWFAAHQTAHRRRDGNRARRRQMVRDRRLGQVRRSMVGPSRADASRPSSF